MLGADFYETLEQIEQARSRGLPPVGIGEQSVIEREIVDKNARIGRGVRIVNDARVQNADADGYHVRDGIFSFRRAGWSSRAR